MPGRARSDVGAALVAALLACVALAALWQSRDFTRLGAIFPRAIGAALLVSALVSMWRAWRGLGPASRGLPREGWMRGLLMVAVMALWIGLLERAGFVATGVTAFVALALITDRRPTTPMRLFQVALVAAVVVVSFQLLFVQGLKVQLPTGTWFAVR